MPMLLVLVEAFKVGDGWGFTNFVNLDTRGARDLLNISVLDAASNSLRNMVLAAGIAFVLGTLISWLLVRTKQKLFDLVFLVPLGVSSVVLGFGFNDNIQLLNSKIYSTSNSINNSNFKL